MDDVLAEHISQHTHELIGPCAAVYHNRLGGRVVSLAYTPWAFTQSLAKRHQWRNLVAWLAGGTPTAWVLESYRVVPFVRSDGKRWVVLLINASMDGPERYGMSGQERATLYKLAIETGLRAGELASLTRASFTLDADKPTVTVDAAYSKRRRQRLDPKQNYKL